MLSSRPVGGDDGRATRERLAAIGEIAAEIAHELRNALQIVSSSAYVARQEAERGEAARAQPHLIKVEKYARIAHDIVDDLLLLARAEAPAREPALVVDAIAAARVDLPAGTVEWDDHVEPRDLRVAAHPGLLGRLLHVLYENAIQASPGRLRVRTTARAEAATWVIEVEDDGPGIPAELAPRLFEPLVTARAGGTGLGLALARRIALAHEGSIVLADRGPEPCGARFLIELPRTR